MTIAPVTEPKVWQRRDRKLQLAIWAAWLAPPRCLFIVSTHFREDIWAFVLDAPEQAADLGARMVPPDWKYIHMLWRPLWDTLNIATIGTLISIVLAVPVAYCAARNTTPSVTIVRPIALFIIVSTRSINL